MTNARGSKSAPKNLKAPKPAPEVTIDMGTTIVLPNPADAPAPPKPGKKKKAAPTIVATPAPELGELLERSVANAKAARKKRGPPTSTDLPTTAASESATTKWRATAPAKPAKSKDATPGSAPGSLRAIGDGWLGSLKAAGHTPSTISSYGNDLGIAYEHFGEARVAAEITERQITAFNASDLVTKKANGKPKAQPTILKTRRALRLALVWAEQKKLIAKAPYSAKTPA